MIEIIYCETWNHNDLSINIYNVLVKHMFISNQITSLYHYIKLNVYTIKKANITQMIEHYMIFHGITLVWNSKLAEL